MVNPPGETNAGGKCRALTTTYTILEVPYYNYSTMGPKTLFCLLRPLQSLSAKLSGFRVWVFRDVRLIGSWV